MAAGIEPAQTLKDIGGVGGALAGEAQRVFDNLQTEAEKEIARRVFLGVVQLGEGARDTRRRASLDSVRSAGDDPELFRQVVNRFAAPGVRLLTLAAEETVTAEVTHEALFEHWQLLNDWLDGSRDDLRFQRRLEDAARHWDEQGRPSGSLWRPPDLDLLQQFHERAAADMTGLQVEFYQACDLAEANRKKLRMAIVGALGCLALALGELPFSRYGMPPLHGEPSKEQRFAPKLRRQLI